MSDLNDIKKMLEQDIAAIEQSKLEAIGRANYYQGQLDAKRQMLAALSAPPEPVQSDDEAAVETAHPPAQKHSRKLRRKLAAIEKAKSSNGHSHEPLPDA